MVGLLALVLPLIVGQTLRLVDDVESGDMQRRVLRVESILPEQAAAPCKDWQCCCLEKQRSMRKVMWLRLRAKRILPIQTWSL